jgi:hypothetical protein
MSKLARIESRLRADDRSILPLQFWDTPHNFDLDQLDVPLSTFSSVVYVMDMQVSYRVQVLPDQAHLTARRLVS